MMISCVQALFKLPTPFVTVRILGSSFLQILPKNPCKLSRDCKCCRERRLDERSGRILCRGLMPVDPWSPTIDSQSIASQLFAVSLFPYIGFLYFITKSKSAPKLTLFGFYFLLAFVGATTKVHYGTSLSNVDWLHGGAESLLTLTNLFIVLGLRQALRKINGVKESTSKAVTGIEEKKPS
ncbi:DUF3593 domain-containing protein, partial [Cephalotus follicularis]